MILIVMNVGISFDYRVFENEVIGQYIFLISVHIFLLLLSQNRRKQQEYI